MLRRSSDKVPAGVVLPMALDRQRCDPALQIFDRDQRLLDLFGFADDADEALHRVLQIVLHAVGVLATLALERRQRGFDRRR